MYGEMKGMATALGTAMWMTKHNLGSTAAVLLLRTLDPRTRESTLTATAGELGLSSAALTGTCDSLAKQGYAQTALPKVPSFKTGKIDRRKRVVEVLPRGEEILQELRDIIAKV